MLFSLFLTRGGGERRFGRYTHTYNKERTKKREKEKKKMERKIPKKKRRRREKRRCLCVSYKPRLTKNHLVKKIEGRENGILKRRKKYLKF